MKRRQPKHYMHSPIPVEGKNESKRKPYSRSVQRRAARRSIVNQKDEIKDALYRGRFPEIEEGVEIVPVREIRRQEKIKRLSVLAKKPFTELERLIADSSRQLKSRRITPAHRKVMERVMEDTNHLSFLGALNMVRGDLRWAKEFHPETLAKESKAAYEGLFFSAIELLNKRHIRGANEILSYILEDYSGTRFPVPESVGRTAIRLARIISRAGAMRKAAEYLKISDSLSTVERRDIIGALSNSVTNLAFVGELQDIEALRIIGRECWEASLEGICAHSVKRIIARDGLMKFLHGNKQHLAGFGIDSRKISDRMLAERIFPLLDDLGFGHIMRMTGGPTGVSAMSWSPVESMIGGRKLAQIKKLGLDAYLKETDVILSTAITNDPEYDLVEASREYLKSTGILGKGKPGWFKLTPKGVQFIKFLISVASLPEALPGSKPVLNAPRKK